MRTLQWIVLWLAEGFLLAGCTTFALVGDVDYRHTDDEGRARHVRIVGLIAAPTPAGNTVVLLPLYKRYGFRQAREPLPAGAMRYLLQQPTQLPPPIYPGREKPQEPVKPQQ